MPSTRPGGTESVRCGVTRAAQAPGERRAGERDQAARSRLRYTSVNVHAVMAKHAQARSAPCAMIRALAAISPIVTDTKPAQSQCASARRKRSAACDTAQARTQLGRTSATVATVASD